MQTTATENQAVIRKQVVPLIRPALPYRCSWFKQPKDIGFSQILAGCGPRLLQSSSEREVSTAESVFMRGYVSPLRMRVCVYVEKKLKRPRDAGLIPRPLA